jgi:hypothetical protein
MSTRILPGILWKASHFCRAQKAISSLSSLLQHRKPRRQLSANPTQMTSISGTNISGWFPSWDENAERAQPNRRVELAVVSKEKPVSGEITLRVMAPDAVPVETAASVG